jgi:hypothetical protein
VLLLIPPEENWEHPTSNIEQPTSKELHLPAHETLVVRCWVLDVGCSF